jgi:hypothetical protein
MGYYFGDHDSYLAREVEGHYARTEQEDEMNRWWVDFTPDQAAAELPGLYEEREILARELADARYERDHKGVAWCERELAELAEVIAEIEALAAQEVEVAA